MKTVRTFRVRCELDETGWYAVTVPEVPGCITQAQSIPDALTRARDALALLVGDDTAASAELLADVVGVSAPRSATG
jgi:predicted RNase H-like HicB family nuclease